jgi:hypothetical protein
MLVTSPSASPSPRRPATSLTRRSPWQRPTPSAASRWSWRGTPTSDPAVSIPASPTPTTGRCGRESPAADRSAGWTNPSASTGYTTPPTRTGCTAPLATSLPASRSAVRVAARRSVCEYALSVGTELLEQGQLRLAAANGLRALRIDQSAETRRRAGRLVSAAVIARARRSPGRESPPVGPSGSPASLRAER